VGRLEGLRELKEASKRSETSSISSDLRGGSAFILVLWVLFFLSIMSIAVRAYAFSAIRLADYLKRRCVCYYLARAGVKRAMLKVKEDETPTYDSLQDSWAKEEIKEIPLGEGRFTVEAIVDEERKININKVPRFVLENLLEKAGVGKMEAMDISACILDWRDKDSQPYEGGAEDDYYQGLEFPYPCKDADFEVVYELLLVRGMEKDIFEKIKDRITVYGNGAININTADAQTLEILGINSSLIDKIMDFRTQGNVFKSKGSIITDLKAVEGISPEEKDILHNLIQQGLLGVISSVFSTECRGEIGEGKRKSKRSIKIVFTRTGEMLFWQER